MNRCPTRPITTTLAAASILAATVTIGCGRKHRRDETRLYPGAPPTIPHGVAQLGRQDCLHCHQTGSPLARSTPHPELVHCAQCHVQQKTRKVFVPNAFVAGQYLTRMRAHAKAPLLIPHPLTLRENCMGCHAGPFVPTAIRTTHPERTRCMQCHVPAFRNWPGPRTRTVAALTAVVKPQLAPRPAPVPINKTTAPGKTPAATPAVKPRTTKGPKISTRPTKPEKTKKPTAR